MNKGTHEQLDTRREARFEESTVELFRRYLKEIVLGGSYSGTSLLSWSDN